MALVSAGIYRGRGLDFQMGVLLMRGDQGYRQSAALLAIHAAISYSDALRSSLDSESKRVRNHTDASTELRRLLSFHPGISPSGLRHLDTLISKKDAVAYGPHRLDENEFRLIMSSVDRFISWFTETSRNLRLEGWNTDAN